MEHRAHFFPFELRWYCTLTQTLKNIQHCKLCEEDMPKVFLLPILPLYFLLSPNNRLPFKVLIQYTVLTTDEALTPYTGLTLG